MVVAFAKTKIYPMSIFKISLFSFLLLLPFTIFGQLNPQQAISGSIYVVSLSIEDIEGSTNLGILDPSTSAVTIIGNIEDYETGASVGFVTGIAVNSSGRMYGTALTAPEGGEGGPGAAILIEIDPATGQAEFVTELSLGGFLEDDDEFPLFKSHLAFDANNRLFSTSLFIGVVFEINIETGECIPVESLIVGDIGFGENLLFGIERNPVDNLLYFIQESHNYQTKLPESFELITYDSGEDETNVLGTVDVSGIVDLGTDIVFDAEGSLYLLGSFLGNQDRKPVGQLLFEISLEDGGVSELDPISGIGEDVVFTATLAPAIDGIVYVTTGSRDGSRLGSLDPVTGVVSIIGSVVSSIGEYERSINSLQGIAVNTEGEIWVTGVVGEDRDRVAEGNVLAQLNPLTGEAISIFGSDAYGPIPITFGEDGILYGVLEGEIASFNLITGIPTFLGPEISDEELYITGMATDPISGLIYISVESYDAGEGEEERALGLSYSFYTYNSTTNVLLLVTTIPVPLRGGLPDIFFDVDGNLYATGNGNESSVFIVNLEDEEITRGADYGGTDLNGAGLPGATFFLPDDNDNEPGAAVPTMSQWGLIILALSLLIFSLLAVRQSRPGIVRATD